MDLRQWEVAEREPDPVAELGLDALDRPERLSRVRALVVAVLDDEPPLRAAADVIHRVVEPIQHPRFTVLLARSRQGGRRYPPVAMWTGLRQLRYPRHIWLVDELPKGPTGKLLKRAIKPPDPGEA